LHFFIAGEDIFQLCRIGVKEIEEGMVLGGVCG
jgi:hypothetical protein